jgi:hypothetical protein
MKKEEKRTVGVYDRPEKRNTKPIIIAVALALVLLVAIFLVRAVYGMPHYGGSFAEPEVHQSYIAPVSEGTRAVEVHQDMAPEDLP